MESRTDEPSHNEHLDSSSQELRAVGQVDVLRVYG